MAEKETQRTENTEEASHRSDDEELSDEDLNEVAGGLSVFGQEKREVPPHAFTEATAGRAQTDFPLTGLPVDVASRLAGIVQNVQDAAVSQLDPDNLPLTDSMGEPPGPADAFLS